MNYCRKYLNMYGSVTEMQPSLLSVWCAAGGGHLLEMILFAAACILDGCQLYTIGKRLPMNIKTSIMLCMEYMNA